MRSLKLIPAAAVLLGALPAFASFDGTYSGRISPTPGTATAVCTATTVTATVDQGRLSAPGLNGFVNVKAFVTGRVKTAEGHMLAIEGRVEEQSDNRIHLSAGAVDNQSGCSWTIDLVKN